MKQSLILFIALLIISCNPSSKNKIMKDTTDDKFNAFKETFIGDLWKIYPAWATNQGYHKYDSVLEVPDANSRTNELAFCKRYLDTLKTFQIDSLNANNRTDYKMIENQLKSAEWYNTTFRAWEWDPSAYNIASAFDDILSGNYAPLNDRMNSLYVKMDKVPEYYKAAKSNIKNPTIEHTKLAIKQNKGAGSVLESIKDSIMHTDWNLEKINSAKDKIKSAQDAVEEYISYLEKDVLSKLNEKTARSFRIGKELYDKKFEYDIVSGYSAEDIYQKAIKRKAELHSEMLKLTKELWKEKFNNKPIPKDSLVAIKMMIDALSTNHVHRDSLLPAIKKQLPELEAFIKEKNLIFLDPKKPLVVRETPVYQQGVAGAGINAPGPYDKEGNTYYNVTPLTRYSDEQAESYLREYNSYLMQILNIHEAIPGHYTQLIYSNQSPSLIKSIFGNNAMIEGWAVYSERMMLEEGYGNNDTALWLMYYKWHLRSVCNTILDYSVHVLNMKKEDAINLLTKQAFQEKAEAEEKWNRVTLTQVQLCCYFTGFTEIYDFRNELKKKEGDKFNLKEFHEKFLSFGSAPVKYIKELMLQENKPVK
jgi:uncharacterized protein (DUF885 family)